MSINAAIRKGTTGLVVALLAACNQAAGSTQRDPRAAIAVRVAQEASTELALTPDAHDLSTGDIRIEAGPHVGGRLTTYRAWIPRDHWHAYQVGLAGDRIIPLGGFQNPDLKAAAAELVAPKTASVDTPAMAGKLALLADNNGAVRYIFRGRVNGSSRDSRWSHVTPEGWPHDTVIHLSNGQTRVVLTLLSQESRSYAQSWLPTAYAFTFDGFGNLIAWSRRTGERIAAAKVPVARP